MRGYSPVPNDLAFDTRLSLGARAAYPVLVHLAWRAGRREENDAVQLPSISNIADHVGCASSTLKEHLNELRRSGWLETVRRSRREPLRYLIHDHASPGASSPKSDPLSKPESDPLKTPSLLSRAGENVKPKKKAKKEPPPLPPQGGNGVSPTSSIPTLDVIPAVALDAEGQNLPLNALLQACGIDPKSRQVGRAARALNGTKATPGIRHLFWEECRRKATETGRDDALTELQENPLRFAEVLADRIGRKARLIRERQPWRKTVTPNDVADLWLDIELQPQGQASLGDIRAAMDDEERRIAEERARA